MKSKSARLCSFHFKIFAANTVFVVGMLGFCASTITAQSTASSSAAITFSEGGSINMTGKERFPVVAIDPGETANVALQLAGGFASARVAVQALDGGLVSSDGAIGADGSGSLVFQAGVQPGLYRILVSGGNQTATLQFWVLNNQDPAANQPALTRNSN